MIARTGPVRWGILGTGHIARAFVGGALGSSSGVVTAVATRDAERAGLAEAFPGQQVLASYRQMLEDPQIDAVYVALPHPLHAGWGVLAARLGKHVLCEKPMAMTAAEGRAMFAAAETAGTFMAEAFMYRLHPLTNAIIEAIGSGAIGEVRIVRASFGFLVPDLPTDHRLFAPELGGGAVLDVGCYLLSVARLVAGVGTPAMLAEPRRLRALAQFGPTGVDEWSAAVTEFPNGIIADLCASISVPQDNVLRVFGTEGWLEVDEFWFGSGRSGGTKTIRLVRATGDVRHIPVSADDNLYRYQFDACNRAILAGRRELEAPGATRADTLGNMAALDRWISEIAPDGVSRSPR